MNLSCVNGINIFFSHISGPRFTRSEVLDYQKSVKRDQFVFLKLTRNANHDAWRRSFLAQCHTQGSIDAIQQPPPTDTDDLLVCQFKQAFSCAVFNDKILTDKGKELVRLHEHDENAKAVFDELELHLKHSVSARLRGSSLLRHITTSRIDDGN